MIHLVHAICAAALLVPAAIVCSSERADTPGAAIPAAALDEAPAAPGDERRLVVAGGCFWGVQLVFQNVKGVVRAISGYAGGERSTADYESVCSGTTGHAEAVEVTYDASQVSMGTLLRVFFSVAHDPTQLNRQGPDSGSQYRSAIFYSNEEQRRIAEAYIAQLDRTGLYARPLVTEVSPLTQFYAAELHHQDYATLHPRQAYILFHDLPKLEHLRETFPELCLKP